MRDLKVCSTARALLNDKVEVLLWASQKSHATTTIKFQHEAENRPHGEGVGRKRLCPHPPVVVKVVRPPIVDIHSHTHN